VFGKIKGNVRRKIVQAQKVVIQRDLILLKPTSQSTKTLSLSTLKLTKRISSDQKKVEKIETKTSIKSRFPY